MAIMKFSEAKTWRERGRQIEEVKDKCNAIISSLGLPETDARVQGIVHVRQACNTLATIPIRLQQKAETKADVPSLLDLLGLDNPTDLQAMLTDFNANAKASFLVVAQFAFENSMRSVVRAITGREPQRKFKKLARQLVVECHLSDPDQKLELLLLPAYLRNTLHSNGIHTHPNITITVVGEPYVFRQSTRVACVSWSHVFFALFHSLCVYEEAYLSPIVVAIPNIVAA